MSRTLLSLAGFQVIISGRFWVIAEVFAHSFNGAELRYSFSDSFNWRTIPSNEVGVLGMSPQGLPQFELLLVRNFCTSQTILS
jgi:hypothetical protein